MDTMDLMTVNKKNGEAKVRAKTTAKTTAKTRILNRTLKSMSIPSPVTRHER